jgi:hypothetical protein
MAIVYCTHNKINGKKYIGSHSANNPNYLGSGFRLKIAVKKHNKENFERVTLWEGPEEFKQEMEEYWIEYFNAYENPLFYNMSKKGVGCPSNKHHFPKSDITKQKISKSMLGKNNWSVGGYTSKPVHQFDLNNNYIQTYPSVSEAQRQTGITNISTCALNKIKTAGGFKWKYKTTT